MSTLIEETQVSTWFERDRAHVCLSNKKTGNTIVEWWDESVYEAIEDGFLNNKDFHQSSYDYAKSNSLLNSKNIVTIKPLLDSWLAIHPSLGVYCGWKKDGSPKWFSGNGKARKVYGFDSHSEAMALLQEENVEGYSAMIKVENKSNISSEEFDYSYLERFNNVRLVNKI